MGKVKITEQTQRIVADILNRFSFCRTQEERFKVFDEIYNEFNLCTDPFTYCVCTPKEYDENRIEFAKQAMITRYGHCDGLE